MSPGRQGRARGGETRPEPPVSASLQNYRGPEMGEGVFSIVKSVFLTTVAEAPLRGWWPRGLALTWRALGCNPLSPRGCDSLRGPRRRGPRLCLCGQGSPAPQRRRPGPARPGPASPGLGSCKRPRSRGFPLVPSRGLRPASLLLPHFSRKARETSLFTPLILPSPQSWCTCCVGRPAAAWPPGMAF